MQPTGQDRAAWLIRKCFIFALNSPNFSTNRHVSGRSGSACEFTYFDGIPTILFERSKAALAQIQVENPALNRVSQTSRSFWWTEKRKGV